MKSYMLFLAIAPTIASAAADDSFSLSAMHIDETPAGYMQRLQQIEQNTSSLKFTVYQSSECSEVYNRLQTFMSHIHGNDYSDYIMALASSTKLDDDEKLQATHVMIPPLRMLRQRPQEEYQEIVNKLIVDASSLGIDYAIARLLFAAIISSSINLNGRMTESALTLSLKENDLTLAQSLLQHGADPNFAPISIRQPFGSCRSVSAIKLLLQYGGDIAKQHKRQDFIAVPWCFLTSKEHPTDALALLLAYIPLELSTHFGRQWIKELRFGLNSLPLYERLTILLQKGCHYDSSDIPILLKKLEDEKLEQQIEIAFQYDQLKEKPKCKSIFNGLRQRAITGKPLQHVTNRHALYGHIIDLDKNSEDGKKEQVAAKEAEEQTDHATRSYLSRNWNLNGGGGFGTY